MSTNLLLALLGLFGLLFFGAAFVGRLVRDGTKGFLAGVGRVIILLVMMLLLLFWASRSSVARSFGARLSNNLANGVHYWLVKCEGS